ncbi:SH3 domain-containing protein [Clostridium baratii]
MYNKDESIIYDYYVDNEGYRWISWVDASGNRRYMAVKVLSSGKRYGNCV